MLRLESPKWRRIVAIVAGLAVAATIAITAQPLAAAWHDWRHGGDELTFIAGDDQWRELLTAAIEDKSAMIGRPETGVAQAADVLLVAQAVTFCPEEGDEACFGSGHASYIALARTKPEVPRLLRTALAAATITSASVPCPRLVRVRCLTSAESTGAARGERNATIRSFPGTRWLARASRAVIARDGSQALLYMDGGCEGPLCQGGELVLLSADRAGWRVDTRTPIRTRTIFF